jgi:class 3 adenylate cyclase
VDTVEATFGFVDLAGFTALTEAHGDEQAVSLLDRFAAIAEASLGPRDRLVKTIGDAVMVAFADPDAALDGTARLFEACLAEAGMPVPRAGLHHGEAIERDDDFFGATVNLAARVAGQAYGGQVLATAPVADTARQRGIHVVDLGSFTLRNLAVPVELFELGLCPASAGTTIDPVCRMQVPRTAAAGRLRHHDTDYWFCSLECAASFAADPSRFVEDIPTGG